MKVTKRELEILELISNALSNNEIASTLYISPETVKSHRRSLLSKLDAKNSAGLVRKGFENGYLQLNTPRYLEIAS